MPTASVPIGERRLVLSNEKDKVVNNTLHILAELGDPNELNVAPGDFQRLEDVISVNTSISDLEVNENFIEGLGGAEVLDIVCKYDPNAVIQAAFREAVEACSTIKFEIRYMEPGGAWGESWCFQAVCMCWELIPGDEQQVAYTVKITGEIRDSWDTEEPDEGEPELTAAKVHYAALTVEVLGIIECAVTELRLSHFRGADLCSPNKTEIDDDLVNFGKILRELVQERFDEIREQLAE